MSSPNRLLVIADVGGDDRRHIGDEAMLEANLEGFRRLLPGVTFTVVSRDPAWTSARFGVESIRETTSDAMQHADGVVVSGGGNLSASWPDLLAERVALLQLAHAHAKPAVVLGQTIGPQLEDAQRRLVAEALSTARFAGIRELPSLALALSLGIPPERIWYQCDDALFLDGSPAIAEERPSIAVTIDPQIRAAGPAVFDALVQQLRELSAQTRAHLTLIPHAFGDETGPSDLTEANVLAQCLTLPHTKIAAGLSAREAVRNARDAAMIISSRYHPIVFGLAAGVASIGIYGDEYCRIKLQGALAHANLERWTLTYADVARGQLLRQALELWQARDKLRQHLEARRDAWRQESNQRWERIVRALDPAQVIEPAAAGTMFGRPIEEIAPALAAAVDGQRPSLRSRLLRRMRRLSSRA